MSILVKKEFYRWVESLDPITLNEIDCKFLNLLIDYFDTLLPLSTVNGARAHKIVALIQDHNSSLDATFPDIKSINTDGSNNAKNIRCLKIGPFRGFAHSEEFVFDKKYTFMYGPNGSGKSSFCEGLEYALIGDIEEANARRISVEQYIKNAQIRSAVQPEVYSNDSKIPIEKNSSYRFAFIEKNKIDSFARIAATTASIQKDRIAILFGLDAFSGFVDGFTDDMKKYLQPKKKLREEFEEELKKNTDDQNKFFTNNTKISNLEDDINTLIKESNQKNLKTLDDLELFLNGNDGISGYIADLRREESKKIPEDLNLEKIDGLPEAISTISGNLDELKTNMKKYAQLSSNVNFQELFLAIEKIGKSENTDTSFCPACKTPITKTTVNPFINAIEELNNLKSLKELQETIKVCGNKLSVNVRNLLVDIKSVNSFCKQSEHSGKELPLFTEFVFTDIASINSWMPQLEIELLSIQEFTEEIKEIRNHIAKYNEILAEKRILINTNSERISKYVGIDRRRIEILTTIENLKNENKKLQKSIDDFATANVTRLQAIETEDKKIAINQQFLISYSNLISHLKTTRDLLPSRYSVGLSVKAKEYYNIINTHDPDFEKIDSLVLPIKSNDKIEIQFLGDSTKHDALYVLSEGHLKVLGLSILLAKAVSENLGFLIFDDIVNAIDDDHRDGVADLLMCHDDMKSRQIIITCHGESFIKKLEHKLGYSDAGKHVKSIQFVPIDVVQERGVQVSIGNSKHYLIKAEECYKKNSLKDSANECRRAVESIATQLWNKLNETLKINLKVTMRSPGSQPDLSTVVDSLLKEISNKVGAENLYIKMSDLKTNYSWSLLNKGAHEDDKQPEFGREEIKNLIELIKEIESLVKSTKLRVTMG